MSWSKCVVVLTLLLSVPLNQVRAAENLLLVTLDGLRWQEVFRGPDHTILASLEKQQQDELNTQFVDSDPANSRKKLMPFLWQTIATKGVLIGNRQLGSNMNVSNDMWFSYPGYNELLTGQADPDIISNDLIDNPNTTMLEWLNNQAAYRMKVAVFGSWDAFGAIINQTRSKIMVNSGFQIADWPHLSEQTRWLNALQTAVPSPWPNVRHDAFTTEMAKQYILAQQPKVIYVALGETDDFAHENNYAEYLRAAHRDDRFIAELWQLLQSLPAYRNNTNLLITVDHGRGQQIDDWQHHSSTRAMQAHGYQDRTAIVGSDQIWLAAIGPDIRGAGESAIQGQFYLSQVAPTALHLLGQPAQQYNPKLAAMLPVVMDKQ